MRKPILPAAVIAVALLACTVVGAEAAQLTTDPNAGTDVVVRDVVHPLAPQTITQSTEPDTLRDGTSVACVGDITTENSWLRLFDLDGDHGLVGTYSVESVDWGIQNVRDGTAELTVNAYCLDEGLPFLYQFMTLQDAVTVTLTDQSLEFHNTVIGGSCDTATEDMAIDLHAEHCAITGCTTIFIGMNDQGQSAPTYIASESCGINEPLDLWAIGFMDAHLVMKVNGDEGSDGGADDGGSDDGGGDVPATTGVGAVLLLLILLSSGAYYMRRRARG